MDQLISRGIVTRGFLGLAPEDLTPTDQTRYGVKAGALVTAITEGSPAAKAGLHVEDVVTSFNGKPIAGERELREFVARAAPGSSVSLDITRDKKTQQITAVLGDVANQQSAAASHPRAGKIGLQIAVLTPDIATSMGLDQNASGVVVIGVEPGSPSLEAGFKPGDILVRIGGAAVTSASQAEGLIANMGRGEMATFVVLRGHTRLLVRVPTE